MSLRVATRELVEARLAALVCQEGVLARAEEVGGEEGARMHRIRKDLQSSGVKCGRCGEAVHKLYGVCTSETVHKLYGLCTCPPPPLASAGVKERGARLRRRAVLGAAQGRPRAA
ncbi:hypothetical protein T484DRAFT_1892792 [Baffinella frigidus]|nr:hypothetical protein T484DRAFT_1892792 [Cryptophyta sp. CCMP2293]